MQRLVQKKGFMKVFHFSFCFLFLLLVSFRAFSIDSDLAGDIESDMADTGYDFGDGSSKSFESFKDISVIQKKFLPKTRRFELSGSTIFAVNNSFQNTYGGSVTASYNFNERFAIEGFATFFSSQSREISTSLEENYNIQSQDLVTPENMLLATIKWSPVYGKISLFESTVNPFELYFNFGGGVTYTEDGQTAPTAMVGTGQIYPLTKMLAFRWDLFYTYFSADGKDSLKSSLKGETVNQSYIFLSVGISAFVPEVKTR